MVGAQLKWLGTKRKTACVRGRTVYTWTGRYGNPPSLARGICIRSSHAKIIENTMQSQIVDHRVYCTSVRKLRPKRRYPVLKPPEHYFTLFQFDASANGCFREGLELIVFKRLFDALTNGDAILGVVASSAVNQNNICVTSSEAQTMRFICAFKAEAEKGFYTPVPRTLPERAGILMNTFVWKPVNKLELQADVCFPKTGDEGVQPQPIGALDLIVGLHALWLTQNAALMIRGGRYLRLNRKDIPIKHVRVLLRRVFSQSA